MTTPGLLTTVTALLALGAAFGAGLYLPRLLTPGDYSAEAGFARDMVTHHAQAVEMSMTAAHRGSRDDLRLIGQDIALARQAQIGTMRAWLRQWHLSPAGPSAPLAWMSGGSVDSDVGHPPTTSGMATPEQLAALRDLTGAAFDAMFIDLMIRHHEGDTAMINAILEFDPHPQVRELALSMRASQQHEIGALRDIRDKPSPAGR